MIDTWFLSPLLTTAKSVILANVCHIAWVVCKSVCNVFALWLNVYISGCQTFCLMHPCIICEHVFLLVKIVRYKR